MRNLRPECKTSSGDALPDDTVLFLVRESVAKRRELIHGRLDDGYGNHCAMGAFWADNPKAVVNDSLLQEVAAVNDSVPPSSTAKERWKKVNSWLRFKISSLTKKSK